MALGLRHLQHALQHIKLRPLHLPHFSTSAHTAHIPPTACGGDGGKAWSDSETEALLVAIQKYTPKSASYSQYWQDIILDYDLNLALHDRLKSSVNPVKLLSNKYKSLHKHNKIKRPVLASDSNVHNDVRRPAVVTSVKKPFRAHRRIDMERPLQLATVKRLDGLCAQLDSVYDDIGLVLDTIDKIRNTSGDRLSVDRWMCMLNALVKHNQLEQAHILMTQCFALLLMNKRHIYTEYMKVLMKRERYDEAHALLSRMRADGIAPDMETYNVLMPTGKQSSGRAVNLLDQIIKQGVVPDSKLYRTVLHAIHSDEAATQDEQIQRTVTVMKSMQHHIATLDTVHYTALILIFGQHLEHDQSRASVLQLYETMRCAPRHATVAVYNIVMRAMAHTNNTAGVLQVFHYTQSIGIEPDVHMYNQVLQQLVYRRRTTYVLHVLRQMMRQQTAQPDQVTLNTMLSMCPYSKYGALLSILLFEYMTIHSIKRDVVAYKSVIQVIDDTDNLMPYRQSHLRCQTLLDYLDRSLSTRPELYTYLAVEYPCATLATYGVCARETSCAYSHDLKYNTQASAVVAAQRRLNNILGNTTLNFERNTLYVSGVPTAVPVEQVVTYFKQFDDQVTVVADKRAASIDDRQYTAKMTDTATYDLCLYDNVFAAEKVPRVHTFNDTVISVLPAAHVHAHTHNADKPINTEQVEQLRSRLQLFSNSLWDTVWLDNRLMVKYTGDSGVLALPLIDASKYSMGVAKACLWLTLRHVRNNAHRHQWKQALRVDCVSLVAGAESALVRHISDDYKLSATSVKDVVSSRGSKHVFSILVPASVLKQRYEPVRQTL